MTEEEFDGPLEAGKGPDAFRTISEVADDLGLPQHVLRFWETRFPQIKPIKRGGGRRYYRPNDVELLRGVKQLLYGEGYTIRGVQRILREQGGRKLASAAGREASAPSQPAETQGLQGPASGPEIWAPRGRPAAPEPAYERPQPVFEDGFGREPDVPQELDYDAAPPVRGSGGWSSDQLGRLSSALNELVACRRLLGEGS